jgi:hypothetical protein
LIIALTGLAPRDKIMLYKLQELPDPMISEKNNRLHPRGSAKFLNHFIMSKGGTVRSSTVLTTDYWIIGNDIDHKTTKISRAIEFNAKGKAIIAMAEREFWTLAAKCLNEA